MKKILIVASSLNVEGGIGNCLAKMIAALRDGCPDCELTLQLLQEKIPDGVGVDAKDVRILPLIKSDVIEGSLKSLVISNLRRPLHLLNALRIRLLFKAGYSLPLIRYQGNHFNTPDEEFDIAVSYASAVCNYSAYVAKHVRAKRKILWCHVNIDQHVASKIKGFSMLKIKNIGSFSDVVNTFDSVVCVSKDVEKSVLKEFPETAGKTQTIYNFVDKERIVSLGQGKAPEIDYDGIKLLTVGRVSYEKGIDLAVKAAKILRDGDCDFRWYFLGDDHTDNEIKQYIKENSLGDCLVFLGRKDNPYPYFRACDLYVHTSYIEGFCTAVNEARMLALPIVTTASAGAIEQIENGINGIVTDTDPGEIAAAVKAMIDSPEKRKSFAGANEKRVFSNKESLLQTIQLFNE